MSIIDISHFTKGILHIEGIVDNTSDEDRGWSGVAVDVITDDLNSYIDIYEDEYLSKMFGDVMYGELIEYLESRPTEEDDRDERWERLIRLLDGSGISKLSPIACYVYFHYVRNNQTIATHIGTMMNESDNPIVSSNSNSITAWNQMVRLNMKIENTIANNLSDYPEWCHNLFMTVSINPLGF